MRFGISMPGIDLWRRCRHREKGVFSVVEVVLEEGRQYARSRSIVNLPNRRVPPTQLFFLTAAVNIDSLHGNVSTIRSVLPVPGVVHLRRPSIRNGLGRVGGLVILRNLGGLLVACEGRFSLVAPSG